MRIYYTSSESGSKRRAMNADKVLDNWSDIESDDSDISSSKGENAERESERESSEQDDVDDSRQSWREVPGL